LLITRDALQDVAKQPDALLGVFIITYERDSVWQFRGAALVSPAAIEAHTRTIRVIGRSYRYQEVVPEQVVSLLEHPMGTVPISRPMMAEKSVPGASSAELIADFRLLIRDDKRKP